MKYCISDISKIHLLSAWAFGEQKGRLALESPSMIFCVRGSPNCFKGDSSKKIDDWKKIPLVLCESVQIWCDFQLSSLFVSRISFQSKWLRGASKQMAVSHSHSFCRYCKLPVRTKKVLELEGRGWEEKKGEFKGLEITGQRKTSVVS